MKKHEEFGNTATEFTEVDLQCQHSGNIREVEKACEGECIVTDKGWGLRMVYHGMVMTSLVSMYEEEYPNGNTKEKEFIYFLS